jgi:hypothetical protein
MSAYRVTANPRPMDYHRGPIHPMTAEQSRFWRLRRERNSTKGAGRGQ